MWLVSLSRWVFGKKAFSFLPTTSQKGCSLSQSLCFYQRWIMRAISSRWYDVSRRGGENLVVKRDSSHAESYVDFTICLSERRGCCDAPRDHVSWNVTYVSRDAPKTTDERRQRESSRNRGTATAARGRGVTRQTQGMRCVNQSVTIERRRKRGKGCRHLYSLERDPRTEAKKCSECENLKKKK